jgi:predicted SAM-dependent methyltransferase/ectoine hydroxylase-related dioxygenase (phytanoyl-CoA dioxygenase family)
MQILIDKFRSDGFVEISKNDSFDALMTSVKKETDDLFQEYAAKVVPEKPCFHHGRAIEQRLDAVLPSELINDNPLYGKRFILDVTDFPKNLIKVVEHDHILNIAKKMLSTDKVVLHNGSISAVYPGNTGNGDMYHTDTSNFCKKKHTLSLLEKNKHIVNIMILFDDVTKDLAPMHILKKTHEISLHKKINDHVSKKLNYSNKYENLNQVNWIYKELIEDFDLEEVCFTGNYGDIAVMNSFVLHKASPNYTSNKTRRVMILNFGREADREFTRKYRYKKSKLFLSKLNNKQIGNLTYKKNSSYLFKMKWYVEAKLDLLKKLIDRFYYRILNPSVVLAKIYFKIYLIFTSIFKIERNYLNIGGGHSFRHPKFYSFDIRDDLIYNDKSGLIKFDFGKGLPLPFEDSSLSGIYSSHCLEHLTDKQVNQVLIESYRILKPMSPIRIVLPDMKQMFDSFDKREAHYFEEFRSKQKRPNFLWIYDTWLRLISRSFAGHVIDEFSDKELEDMYSKLDRNEYISEILKKEKNIPEYRFVPNCHKSYWDYNKLEKILTGIGFTKVSPSRQGLSKNSILRNRALFDNTAPKRSFILEAFK